MMTATTIVVNVNEDKTASAIRVRDQLIRSRKKGEITMYVDGAKVSKVAVKQYVE